MFPQHNTEYILTLLNKHINQIKCLNIEFYESSKPSLDEPTKLTSIHINLHNKHS